MRVTTLAIILFVAFAALVAVNTSLLLLSSQAARNVLEIKESRFGLNAPIRQSQTVSQNLTRFARMYVLGNTYMLDHYFYELSLMDDLETMYEQLADSGATPLEIAGFREGLTISNQLREIESLAFLAIYEGDVNYAITLLYGLDFASKAQSMDYLLNSLYDSIAIRITYTATLMSERVHSLIFYSIVTMGISFFAFVAGIFILYHKVKGAYERESLGVRLREKAEEENNAKTRFLARMSHEIRTPINAVLNISGTELRRKDHPHETKKSLSLIHSSTKALLNIFDDIIDLSKVESDKMEINSSSYDVSSLIMDTVQLNKINITSKEIKFEVDVDYSLPQALIGDEIRIKQIINNLLSNAIKYTTEGIICLSFYKEKYVGHESIMLIIEVKDTGCGMTREQSDYVFDSELDGFSTEAIRQVEGSGMGLIIASKLARLMHGHISVESKPQKGSVFTVRIPQKIENKAILGESFVEKMKNPDLFLQSDKRKSDFVIEQMPYGRVLLVDDVESNILVLKRMIVPYKIQVEAAKDGLEAVNNIKMGNTYDIIFMDYMMPVMDGLEATRTLRGMGYDKPIVTITANTTKGVSELFMSSGSSDFMAKPVDIKKLNKCLVTFIKDRHPAEASEICAVDSQILVQDEYVPALSVELIDSFLRDAKKSIEILEPILLNEDFSASGLKTFSIQVHAMKSALANIGELNLSGLAATLEDSGLTGDTKTIMDDTPKLLKSLRELIDRLTPQEPQEDECHDEDLDFVRAKLIEVRDACADYNKKGIKKALAEINQGPCSNKTKALTKEISALVLNGDYEEAAELAEKEAMQYTS